MVNQVETRASHAGPERLPGAIPGIAIAILSGAVVWAALAGGTLAKPGDNAAANASELAPVDDEDMAAAAATLSSGDSFLAEYKERQGRDHCQLPLAWVSISHPAGGADATIRLRSGRYISPAFRLGEVPVRVAIPYPAPYDVGHGSLTVLVDGGAAVIALRPAWQTQPGGEGAVHQVTWPVAQRCK